MHNALFLQCQTNNALWLPTIHVPAQYDDHGFAVNVTYAHLPWNRPAIVVAKVRGVGQAARKAVCYQDTGVGADQFA
jgi:hypothetical protein